MKVTFEQLKAAFNRVLISRGVDSETADACAEMFARTTESGVYSHGVNRFPRFIQQLENGDIIPDAQPKLTAKKMMDRAIELAADHGIGLVALRNANHWMRGGSYGWQAAEKGYIGICWTNSIAVMPPWGAKECRIGTNPLIVAIPSTQITMVDMSMSMFSYGMLEVNRLAGRQLPVDGGFDDEGNLTKEPGVIEKNRRILPMGYWKGSGMPSVLTKIRPFAYPAMNLLPCWPKTAVTASLLMTACGPKSRRYEEISHDFWTYRAAQSVPFARRH